MWSALRPLLVFAVTFATALFYIHLDLAPEDTPDFTVFHAAGQPGPVYDPEWIAAQQDAGLGPRLYAYPPTFLLILRSLGLLSFELAFSLWLAASVTLFVEAAKRASPAMWWLVLLSPMFLVSARLGQTSLLLGALLTLGLFNLKRPVLAGVLLGLAFAIKPQVMLLMPPALLLWGCWRAFLTMGVAGFAVCLASLVFGPGLWLEWLASLGKFSQVNEQIGVGIGAPWPFNALIAPLALGLVYLVRHAEHKTRLVAVIGGSIVVSPHAGTYETAMLLPAIAGLIYPLQWRTAPALGMFLIRFKPWWITAGLVLLLAISPALDRRLPVWLRAAEAKD